MLTDIVCFCVYLALKKSQKEASFLVEKCGKGKQTDVSELESGLMNQWRSHFLHMEDIFVNESNQLVSVTCPSFVCLCTFLLGLDTWPKYSLFLVSSSFQEIITE